MIPAGESKIRLIRHPVKGSVCAVNNFGDPIKFNLRDDEIELQKKHEEKIFICFRPWLTMRVTDFLLETDEWTMSSGWKLILEEI
jgi:hypothetical protein